MIGMTKRQADCLRAIEDLTVDGVSPTYDQIAARIGVTTKSVIHRLVVGLERRGHLRRHPHKQQALEVIHPLASAGEALAARLRSLSDEAFAGALDVVAEEIARRAGSPA